MKELKLRGIILNEMPIGENDKRIVIFSKELGKISAFAKKARNPKSKLMSGTQVFTYSDMILLRTSKYITLNQVSVIDTFHQLSEDIFKYTYSMYLLELFEYVLPEEEANAELLKLLLITLKEMIKGCISPELISRIFELKFMSLNGYAPNIINCVACGSSINSVSTKFSARYGGTLCNNCYYKDKSAKIINDGTVYTINYILNSVINKIYKFNVSEEILYQLTIINKDFINYNIDKKFKTLEMLKQLT